MQRFKFRNVRRDAGERHPLVRRRSALLYCICTAIHDATIITIAQPLITTGAYVMHKSCSSQQFCDECIQVIPVGPMHGMQLLVD